MKNEVYAAIAMALYEFKGNNVHDKEPGIITATKTCRGNRPTAAVRRQV